MNSSYQSCVRFPLFAVRDSVQSLAGNLRRRHWLRTMRMHGRMIDMSTDIIGLREFSRIRLDPYCRVDQQCSFWLDPTVGTDPSIQIGERSYIGRNGYLGSRCPLSIGIDCLIGAYVYITTAHHEYRDASKTIREQGLYGGPVTIGSGSWIGTHCVIMPGVTIGEGAIIGASAVVTHDVPAGEIWAGVPAKKIGNR